MNESENKFEAGGSSLEDLRREVQSLRAALAFSLVLVFIFSVCVNLFLLWQTSSASKQLLQNETAINNFQNVVGPQIIEFWNKIKDYSRTHPDFKPIIDRYSPFITVHTNAPAAPKPK